MVVEALRSGASKLGNGIKQEPAFGKYLLSYDTEIRESGSSRPHAMQLWYSTDYICMYVYMYYTHTCVYVHMHIYVSIYDFKTPFFLFIGTVGN